MAREVPPPKNPPLKRALAPSNLRYNSQEREKEVFTEKGESREGKAQEGAAGGIQAARFTPRPRCELVKHYPLVYGLATCYVCHADNRIVYIPRKEPTYIRCSGCGELWPFSSYLTVALCDDYSIIERLYQSRNKPPAYSSTR